MKQFPYLSDILPSIQTNKKLTSFLCFMLGPKMMAIIKSQNLISAVQAAFRNSFIVRLRGKNSNPFNGCTRN